MRGCMMLEMKIGEIRAFRCVEVKDEDNCCVGCMFNDESCCWVDVEILGHCEKACREDGKNVIFVRTDPNEIIRERIEKSIDRLSGGDDEKMIALQTHTGECKIGFKASYWKRMLGEILEVGDARDAVQD